ncbi:hypothetical protein BV25DRAFT_449112 [Artomyces pyxidatus]|uniref:Uncharacterized protein n=1 Tax=Artomyces pyxidatus TaxID=48021 RepID=A0ACB8T318_9AGAM|nr:hypothetical protein BV25DRAFT_449112 [Artomyces pyxidatus]
MSQHLKSERSTEAPMDFQFTSRPSADITPAWKSPQKRPHQDLTAPDRPNAFPTFGSTTTQNVPFLFATPRAQTPPPAPWAPPPAFSPTKVFVQPELHDVDMADASPPKREERAVALGAVRRVFRSRQRRRERARESDESGSDESEAEEQESPRKRAARVQKTSHHYTLNMPSPSARNETPYVLLGYLQFFFNLSLILLFLYLTVQFILTVQRDVEERISEYSMDIVQEISNCATQYKANLCDAGPVPAMVRQCGAWETCMNRDPTIVGRAKVGAELIAEVVNGFVEPISWKTLAFTLSSLGFMTIFINTLLSLYRARLLPSAQGPGVPQGSFGLAPGPGPYVQGAAGWHWAGVEAEEGPSRRRRLAGGEAAKIR